MQKFRPRLAGIDDGILFAYVDTPVTCFGHRYGILNRAGKQFATLKRTRTMGMVGKIVWQLFSGEDERVEPLASVANVTNSASCGTDSRWKVYRGSHKNGQEAYYIHNCSEPNTPIRFFYRTCADAKADDQRQLWLARTVCTVVCPGGPDQFELIVRGTENVSLVLAANTAIDTADAIYRCS